MWTVEEIAPHRCGKLWEGCHQETPAEGMVVEST